MTQRDRINAMSNSELYDFFFESEEFEQLKLHNSLFKGSIFDFVSVTFKEDFLNWLESEVEDNDT